MFPLYQESVSPYRKKKMQTFSNVSAEYRVYTLYTCSILDNINSIILLYLSTFGICNDVVYHGHETRTQVPGGGPRETSTNMKNGHLRSSGPSSCRDKTRTTQAKPSKSRHDSQPCINRDQGFDLACSDLQRNIVYHSHVVRSRQPCMQRSLGLVIGAVARAKA